MIDRRTDYALRALVYLAGQGKGATHSASSLGKVLHISPIFLSKILQTLSSRGIIEATRGRGGGVRIKNERVSLWDVIKIMDPKFSIGRCLDPKFGCVFKRTCRIHELIKGMDRQMINKFSSVKISKLAMKGR